MRKRKGIEPLSSIFVEKSREKDKASCRMDL